MVSISNLSAYSQIQEPLLVFAGGNKSKNPLLGLKMYGPYGLDLNYLDTIRIASLTPLGCTSKVNALITELSSHISPKYAKEYYPDYQLKVILSHSWLFDPVLPMLMPETSNICRYQQTGHIFPRKGPSDAVRRVFGQPAVDNGVESVEWKSSLQKTLGNYITSGGVCRGGGILIFID